jgi:GTP-binding protein
LLFVLIDSRHAPQKIDLEFIQWLGENGVPFSIIFTKADKLTKTALASNIAAYKNRLLEEWEELPEIFITSSETAHGREEVLEYINQVNKNL